MYKYTSILLFFIFIGFSNAYADSPMGINCLAPKSKLSNLASSLKVVIKSSKLDGERSINIRTSQEVMLYNAGTEIKMHNILEGEKVDIKSDTVDFIMEDSNHNERTLDLPVKMKQRFIDYFRHSSEPAYNCYGYVLHLNDWQDTGLNEMDFDRRLVEGVNDLKSGDTIAITQKSTNGGRMPMHYAIYLGDGLFLSKMGAGGRIIVNSFETMKFLYMTEIFLEVITPKVNFLHLLNASA